jgi:hypothetical protein
MMVILECVIKNWGEKLWTEFLISGQEPIPSSCENDNERSGSIKGGKFLEWMRDS